MESEPQQTTTHRIEGKEYIVKPAIRLPNGRIFEGGTHSTIYTQIMRAGENDNGAEEGFVTNKGRFVSRVEAKRIAIEAGQIEDKFGSQLTTEELRQIIK